MLKLVNVKASKQFIYTEDLLYITCTYEALSDYPIGAECEMYCDFIYGHTYIPETSNGSFRAKGKFYPQPMHLKMGESITGSILWKIPKNILVESPASAIMVSDAPVRQKKRVQPL